MNLNLGSTRVSDKGVKILRRLKSLKMLWLSSSKVSSRGKQRLKSALPGCTFV